MNYGSQIKQQYETAGAAAAMGVAGGYIHGGGAVLGAAQSSGDAKRESEVSAELQRLSKTVEWLSITANQLAERLQPVRSPRALVASNTVSPSNPPEANLCLMAERIRGERKQAEQCISVLQTALDELEV